MGDPGPRPRNQFGLQRGPRIRHRHGLDNRLHLLAELFVGHAAHGDIRDLRVTDQRVLCFLGVDVDAARDDHERLAIREVEIAFFIHVADISQRGVALFRARRSSLVRSAPVFELAVTLEVDDADLAGLEFLMRVLVQNVEFADHRTAH